MYPEVTTGFARSCHELSLREVKKGHEIVVVTPKMKGRPTCTTVVPGYTVVRLKQVPMAWDRIGLSNPLVPSLYNFIKKQKCDVMHAYSHIFLTTALAIKACQDSAKPSVVSVHGVRALRDFTTNLLQKAYISTLGLWALKHATKVICLTKADASEIVRLGIRRSKLSIIPNAVDTEIHRSSSDDGFVLWAGRYVYEKGLQYLIDVAEIVKKQATNSRFLLVGEGPLKTKVKHLVSSRGLKNVSLLGPMEYEKLRVLMGQCSIFAFPSLKEGFPRVLLEAMACEKPVVAFDIPGINEIISDKYDGLLVPLENTNVMAQAITDLMNDKNLRKKIGMRARKKVIEKFDWRAVEKKIERLYQDAIDSKARTLSFGESEVF